MNKTIFALLVLILCSLVTSCASSNVPIADNTVASSNVPVADNTVKSGIIIECADSGYSTIYVYIDGSMRNLLHTGSIHSYELENGYHTVYFEGPYSYGDTDAIGFTVNNDRHHFKVKLDSIYTRVVSHDIIPVKASASSLLDTAIKNSFDIISRNVPVNAKIAIVNIASNSMDNSNYILEELTLAFVNSRKFTVVDRQTLDVLRQEHNFQLSGEVSDETIVSIGNFTGAGVVITGVVSGTGEMRRLRLRALDVKTAEVLAMSSEKI
jgi:hypothetical protein